jgi:hypothetical protein
MRAVRNPESEADALRFSQPAWRKLRPFVVAEFEAWGLDSDKELTKQWCKRVLTYFEQCWLAENEEMLKCGYTNDCTGGRYLYLGRKIFICVKLRELREGLAESGTYPTCPAVRIDEPRLKDHGAINVTWDPDAPADDAREIWKTDGDTKLSLGEFVLWSARTGCFSPEFNPKYFVDDARGRTTEPNAYVPSDWTGKPKKWLEEVREDYPHWRFWMKGETLLDGFPDKQIRDMSGRILTPRDLRSMSEENMRRCCLCFGLPPPGKELILCECGDRLYCCEEHKEKYMEYHKYDPELGMKHPSAKYVCLNCGKEDAELKRCARCNNAFFCDKDCQKMAWKDHKKCCRGCID